MYYRLLHGRLVCSSIPVDVGQDEVERDVLYEVPDEESNVKAGPPKVDKVPQRGWQIQNFESDRVTQILKCSWELSSVQYNSHAQAGPKRFLQENEDGVVVREAVSFL